MNITNIDDIRKLASGDEGGRTEYKLITGQLERGMETLCAFLNGEGGTRSEERRVGKECRSRWSPYH